MLYVQKSVIPALKNVICSKIIIAKYVQMNAVPVLMNAEIWQVCNKIKSDSDTTICSESDFFIIIYQEIDITSYLISLMFY